MLQDRENAVNLCQLSPFVSDDQEPMEFAAGDQDSEHEVSKSTLSNESETDTNMSVHNSSLIAEATNLQQHINEIPESCPVCNYTPNSRDELDEHITIHTEESQKPSSPLYSEKVRSPQKNIQSKIPTPMSRSYISSSQPVYTTPHNQDYNMNSSQPVNTSSTILRKRLLSTSPQNNGTPLINKSAKVNNTFLG